jgi:hypothetical protein
MKKPKLTEEEMKTFISSRHKEATEIMKAQKKKGLTLQYKLADYKKLLNKGMFFSRSEKITSNPDVKTFLANNKPQPKECFYNCQMFILYHSDSGAQYFEGYYASGTWVVQHAWLVIEGKVFDPTLDSPDFPSHVTIVPGKDRR